MKRSRQVFLITSVLVLCAGVVVGRLWAKLAVQAPPVVANHQPSWLADQLGLSADQHQQMDAIWAGVKQEMHKQGDKRNELERQRDDAIRNLLTDEQWTQFEAIHEIYRDQRAQMDKERDALIKSAEERSRALLTDAQKAKWDQMAKDMHGHRPGMGPGPGMGPPGMGPGIGPGMDDGPHPGFGPATKWSDDHGPDMRGPDMHGPDFHGPPDHDSQPH